MQIVIAAKLALQFGDWGRDGKLHYSRKVIAITDFADAVAKWETIRGENGFRAGNCPIVVVVDTTTGEQVAKISYNGRVWGADGKEIRVNGCKLAAEHEADGWADYKPRTSKEVECAL